MKFNKYWNKRIGGIPAFVFLLLSILTRRVVNKIYSTTIKANFKTTGKGFVVGRNFRYRYPNHISIGDNVVIGEGVSFTSELETGWLVIKNNVIIGRGAKLDFSGGIIIEEGALLSEGVVIQTHDHGLNPRSLPIGSTLKIESNTWIGMNATILSKVETVGKGAIIGANSLVTKSVSRGEIVGGNPCKVIRRLS